MFLGLCSLRNNKEQTGGATRPNAVSHSLAGGMGRMATLQAAAILNVQQLAMARRPVRPIAAGEVPRMRISLSDRSAIGRTAAEAP